MVLRRRAGPAGPIWFGNWPRPLRAAHVDSDAARGLRDALRRYIEGGVSGRAFLISGHRGAGKTTLVQRAVDELTDSLLSHAVEAAKFGIDGQSLVAAPQRPLLVRVHGPSLPLAELPGPGAGEAPDDGEARVTKQSILVQLSVALYRALADECATCFALLARAPDARAEWPEIAAQLRLALDDAPDPALLRAYWERFDAVQGGGFWPSFYAAALEQGGLPGRGLLELIAVATAGQLFEVSAGKVEFSKIKKDTSQSEQKAGEGAARAWAELSGRIPGIGVGAALAGGTAYGLGLQDGLTALAALLGGAAFGWSGSFTRAREDTQDYRVTLDRSAASLERDLPLAISRMRAAGLAPVFTIDELDKLPDIENTMRALMFQLKQLTTDYGFFCFLTDRDYYDCVQRAVEGGAYPLEHSFFSERYYVLHTPRAFDAYIEEMFEPDPPGIAATSVWTNRAEQNLLSKWVLHRSKLNMIDAVRALDSGWRDGGVFEPAADLLRTDMEHTLTVTVQLAVEHVMRDKELFARAREDGGFRQLLVDALYIISRAWERDERTIGLENDDIADHLLARLGVGQSTTPREALADRLASGQIAAAEMDLALALYEAWQAAPDSDAADLVFALAAAGRIETSRLADALAFVRRLAERQATGAYQALVAQVGERDAGLVTVAARNLAALLCDPNDLAAQLGMPSLLAEVPAPVAELPKGINPPLLQFAGPLVSGEPPPQIYRIRYDRFGRLHDDAAGRPLTEREAREAERLIAFIHDLFWGFKEL